MFCCEDAHRNDVDGLDDGELRELFRAADGVDADRRGGPEQEVRHVKNRDDGPTWAEKSERGWRTERHERYLRNHHRMFQVDAKGDAVCHGDDIAPEEVTPLGCEDRVRREGACVREDANHVVRREEEVVRDA